MVPHSSAYANSKCYENLTSSDILTEARQFLDKSAWLSYIRHHPLNTSRKHLLLAMARLYGRHWQQYLSFNTDTFRLHARGQKECQRNLGCAIGKYTYNKLKGKLEITPDTAAGAVYPDGYHARNCGSTQPDQDTQEPQYTHTSQAEFLIRQRLKCKQPPPRTVVQHHNPTTHRLC